MKEREHSPQYSRKKRMNLSKNQLKKVLGEKGVRMWKAKIRTRKRFQII